MTGLKSVAALGHRAQASELSGPLRGGCWNTCKQRQGELPSSSKKLPDGRQKTKLEERGIEPRTFSKFRSFEDMQMRRPTTGLHPLSLWCVFVTACLAYILSHKRRSRHTAIIPFSSPPPSLLRSWRVCSQPECQTLKSVSQAGVIS